MSHKKDLGIARKELSRAQEAVTQMRGKFIFDDFNEIWREFLYRLQRSVIKVRAHFSNNHKFGTWDGNKQKEIGSDKWLQYLLQSRNVEEHRIEVISEAAQRSYVIGTLRDMGNEVIIDKLIVRGGKIL